MDILRQVEDDLRVLALEARKKLPAVEEAAERSLVKLRALREQYVVLLRESGHSPPVSSLVSSDILRPFLLSCNRAATSKAIALHTLGALTYLATRGAISKADTSSVVEILANYASANSNELAADVQVKVLQTLLTALTGQISELPKDTVAVALAACVQLCEHRSDIVRNAASATLRQASCLLFDQMAVPDRAKQQLSEHRHPPLVPIRPNETCAFYLFQDLCLLSRHEQGQWINLISMQSSLGLELIQQILSQHAGFFRRCQPLMMLVRDHVCPLIVQIARSELHFALLVRLMRLIQTVIAEFADTLIPECEVILAMLLQLLSGAEVVQAGSEKAEGSHSTFLWSAVVTLTGKSTSASRLTPWSILLVLNVFSSLCRDGRMLRTICQHYDVRPDGSDTFASLVRGLITSLEQTLKVEASAIALQNAADAAAWSGQGVPACVQGLELLRESSAPLIREGDVPLLNLACLLSLIDTLWSLVLEEVLGGNLHAAIAASLPLPREIARQPSSVADMLSIFLTRDSLGIRLTDLLRLLLIDRNQSPRLHDGSILAAERLCLALAVLNVETAAAQAFTLVAGLAAPHLRGLPTPRSLPVGIDGRRRRCIATFVRLVAVLANVLRYLWRHALQTLTELELLLASPLSLDTTVTLASGSHPLGVVPDGDSDTYLQLQVALLRFPAFSMVLEDCSLLMLGQALIKLCSDFLSMPAEVQEGHHRRLGFTLSELVHITALNIGRIGPLWPDLMATLRSAVDGKNAELRLYALTSIFDLIIKALGVSTTSAADSKLDRTDCKAALSPASAEPAVCLCVVGLIPDIATAFSIKEAARSDMAASAAAMSANVPSQQALLQPLFDLGTSAAPILRGQALDGVHRLLQSCGQVLTGGWPSIFQLLREVALSGSGQTDGLSQSQTTEGTDRSPWGAALLPQAFRAVKLITDDFLTSVPPLYLGSCVQCIGAFVHQRVDINISLTAIGMMTTVTDLISRKVAADIDQTLEHAEVLWDLIFEQLCQAVMDHRPEVRNCALTTLFSIIITHGPLLSVHVCKTKLENIILVVDKMVLHSPSGTSPGTHVAGAKSMSRLIWHHSRDDVGKQWSETQVAALQGLARLHRCFLRLFWSEDWYARLWAHTLSLGKVATSMNREIAAAGIALVLHLTYSASSSGLPQGTFRATAGMRVVDGTLQETNTSTSMNALSCTEHSSLRQSEQESEAKPCGVQKVMLWEQAWQTLKDAAELYVDDVDGELAGTIIGHLQQLYDSCHNEELQGAQRRVDVIDMLRSIIRARCPVRSDTVFRHSAVRRVHVLPNQRAALGLLSQMGIDLPDLCPAIFNCLATWSASVEAEPNAQPTSDPSPVVKPYRALPLTPQFAADCRQCLLALFGRLDTVLVSKADLLRPILESIRNPCVKCAKGRRQIVRREWVQGLSAVASGSGSHKLTFIPLTEDICASMALIQMLLRPGSRAFTAPGLKGTPLEYVFLAVDGYLNPFVLDREQRLAAPPPMATHNLPDDSQAVELLKCVVDFALRPETADTDRVGWVCSLLVNVCMARAAMALHMSQDHVVHESVPGQLVYKAALEQLRRLVPSAEYTQATRWTIRGVAACVHELCTYIFQNAITDSQIFRNELDTPQGAFVYPPEESECARQKSRITDDILLPLINLLGLLRFPVWSFSFRSEQCADNGLPLPNSAFADWDEFPTQTSARNGEAEDWLGVDLPAGSCSSGHVWLLSPLLLCHLAPIRLASATVHDGIVQLLRQADLPTFLSTLARALHSRQ